MTLNFPLRNQYNQKVQFECSALGADHCLLLKYETLVMNPNATLNSVARFLNVSWTDNFLAHNQFVGSKIAISRTEWSTPQIKKPIYKDSLNMWSNFINYDSVELYGRANMLLTFGYNIDVKNYDYLKM